MYLDINIGLQEDNLVRFNAVLQWACAGLLHRGEGLNAQTARVIYSFVVSLRW